MRASCEKAMDQQISNHQQEVDSAPRFESPQRDRRGTLVLVVVVFVALILVAVLIWRWRNASNAEKKTTPVVSVKVAKAEKQAIAAEITAVGTIWPREKSDVAAKVSAQIKKMALLKNKTVKAGEVIAVLESR